MNYTKEDKKDMREALDIVLADLRELFNASNSDSIELTHYLTGLRAGKYNLCINREKICFCNANEPGSFVLDKQRSMVKRPKIKDYDTIYTFLSDYENIRAKVEKEVIEGSKQQELMRQTLAAIKSRYSHESTIEVELEETNNPRTIDVKKENGNTIGEFRFGHDTIRIITKGNIVFVKKDEPTKVR